MGLIGVEACGDAEIEASVELEALVTVTVTGLGMFIAFCRRV